MHDMTINIANDFSVYPAGRTPKDGPNSGERFREAILKPKIRSAQGVGGRVIVILDGVRSYGSSFLEEAFGGLIRSSELSPSDALKILDIQFTRPAYRRYKDLIIKYIKDART